MSNVANSTKSNVASTMLPVVSTFVAGVDGALGGEKYGRKYRHHSISYTKSVCGLPLPDPVTLSDP